MKTTTMRGAVAVVMLAALSAGCGGAGGGGGKPQGTASAAFVGTRVLLGGLVEARTGHQAIATEDGLAVLLVGGKTLTAEATDTAEVWRAGHSTPLPVSMQQARAGHGAVYLPSGEVWIVGGHDARGAALSSTEIYDPVSRTFRPGPALQAPRDEAAVAYTQDGFVLAFGRGEDTLETWSRDLRRGARVRVTEAAAPVAARRGAQALVLEDGQVLVSGGLTATDEPAPALFVDPRTGRARRAEQPVVNGVAVAGSLDGVATAALVVGGSLDGEPFQGALRVRATGAPEQVARGPFLARERAAVVALERGVLVAGGASRGAISDRIEVVTASGSGNAPNLEVARLDAQGTLLADGTVLISGGIGRDGLPVGVSELVVPAGVGAPSAEALYAEARRKQAEWDRLVAERDAALAEAVRLQGELARVEAELAAAEARVRQLESTYARVNDDLAKARADVAAARAEVQALRGQLAAAQGAAAPASGFVIGRVTRFAISAS